ncbi:hypothetical protein OTK49_21275 [Vibrio coralliirubri]|uniref:hypothetical protein n=1 Tax=Vibrio coralliirubri TaxID=1516159 RepID=UPI0022834CA2|nr:hypothetical protein [Vibrio coralliirubri]MCY9865053.1 hypothetical protein [Vibrio coralliirubri]
MVMGKVVVVYEPRKEFAPITEAIVKGGDYSVFSTRSLREVKQFQKQSNIDLVLIDADLQIGDVGVFDFMYALYEIGLKGKVGLLIPSTFGRSRLMSLLASEPICLISRSSLPSEIKKSVGLAITQERVIKPRYLSSIEKHSGKFVNGTIETDKAYIEASGGYAELYLLASREAASEGDISRGMSHLVAAFKLMPYSFTLYRCVLDGCHQTDSVYKVALRFLKAHPVASPYFNGGAVLAFVRLVNESTLAENLQKLMDRRVDGWSKLGL